MKKLFLFGLTAALFIGGVVSEVEAIPAFARKYRMSCQTCHSPIPRLKAFGDEFAGNGFVLADKDAPRYYVETGDPLLSLIRDFPIAVRLEAFVTYNSNNSDQSDLSTPYFMKLLSGGALTQDVSYYFYFYMSERGELVGLEDAFIMFNNLFGEDFDVYVGQFQVSDPLFKRELRLTMEDYKVYNTKVGISKASLTYDRGLMFTYGFDTGTNLIFEIVNGTGLGEANVFKNFDEDKYKNFMGRISQDVNENIRIGAFGYIGKEEQINDFGTTTENDITMFGPDATISFEDKVTLNLQYVYRKDKSVFGFGAAPVPSTDVVTKGTLAELIYTPLGDESEWYGVGMFNFVESGFDFLDYKSASLHVGHLLRRNFRLVGEFTYNFTQKFGQVGVGFVSAF